jgi:hypothetical protein
VVITQLDRGTDLVAIRMRRSAVVLPTVIGVAAELVGGEPILLLAAVVCWGWIAFVFVWLMLRPGRSPRVALPRWPDATRHGAGRARRGRPRR